MRQVGKTICLQCFCLQVKKVFLYLRPVDFRKSIDGLSALVKLEMTVSLFEPAIFVFLNRARNRVKILY